MINPCYFKVPAQPPNLRAVNIDADSVQLMWSKPSVSEGTELLDYSLWYSLSNGTGGNFKEDLLVIKADDTQVILRGLLPDSNYHIRLAGRSVNGHGTTATLDFRTKEHRKSNSTTLLLYCQLAVKFHFVHFIAYVNLSD